MKTKTESTNTPPVLSLDPYGWYLTDSLPRSRHAYFIRVGKEAFATIHALDEHEVVNRANLVLNAVNNIDRLERENAELLKALHELLQETTSCFCATTGTQCAHCRARAALAKHEEGRKE